MCSSDLFPSHDMEKYLERNDYIKTNNMKIKYLEEAMSDKTQFDDNELKELLNYKDETINQIIVMYFFYKTREHLLHCRYHYGEVV